MKSVKGLFRKEKRTHKIIDLVLAGIITAVVVVISRM